jgi:anti-sigma regulatory factor (Ser/Thr protein kinase)
MTSTPAPAPPRPEAQHAPAPLPARTHRTRPGPATRQTSLLLGSVKTAPRTARATLKAALATWGLTPLSDTAEAITSEIVTNAIAISTGKAPPGTEPAPVTVWITAQQGELCIRVWDPDPAPPPPGPQLPDDDAEHGRGLLIVAALASRWGWYPGPSGGKYVWAALPLDPGPGDGHQQGDTP